MSSDDDSSFDDGFCLSQSWRLPEESAARYSNVEPLRYTHPDYASITASNSRYTLLQGTRLLIYDPSHPNEVYAGEPTNLSGQRANRFSTATTAAYSSQGQTYGPPEEDTQAGSYNYQSGEPGYQDTPWPSATQLPHRITPSELLWHPQLELDGSEANLPAITIPPDYLSHASLAQTIDMDSLGTELSNATPAFFPSGSGEQGPAFPQPDAIRYPTHMAAANMRFNQGSSRTPIVSQYFSSNCQLDHNPATSGFLYTPSPEPTTSYNESVTTQRARIQEGRHFTDVCVDCGSVFNGTVAADVRHNLQRHQRHSCPERELKPTFKCRGQGCHSVYKRDDNRREHERKFHRKEGLPPPSKTR